MTPITKKYCKRLKAIFKIQKSLVFFPELISKQIFRFLELYWGSLSIPKLDTIQTDKVLKVYEPFTAKSGTSIRQLDLLMPPNGLKQSRHLFPISYFGNE